MGDDTRGDVNNVFEFDLDWINSVHVNLPSVEARVLHLTRSRPLSKECQAAWLLKAVTCIDLTTLSGDDTASNVHRLCHKACNPINSKILAALHMENSIKVGAVCVYPMQVRNCVDALKKYDDNLSIGIASVAAGFPSGQYPLKSRLEEIRWAVTDGATEIDVVISRSLALKGDWKGIYDELVAMKAACGSALMKTILAAGELGTLQNVYKASLAAMMAGSDFIKTSTGKETVNATLVIGLVMARAIFSFFCKTGRQVGFKPAGGIRTAEDVLNWQILMKEEVGDDWLQPRLFRIGASALLASIETTLFKLTFERPPFENELPIIRMSF